MPNPEDLIPLIGNDVEVRRDQNHTLCKGTLLDVGTKLIFVRRLGGSQPGSIEAIELSNVDQIQYMKKEKLTGPFDGRRAPGDYSGG